MLHACVKKIDVMGNLEIFWKLNRAKLHQKLTSKAL